MDCETAREFALWVSESKAHMEQVIASACNSAVKQFYAETGLGVLGIQVALVEVTTHDSPTRRMVVTGAETEVAVMPIGG